MKSMNKSPSRKSATLIQLIGGYLDTVLVAAQGVVLIPLYVNYIGLHTYGLWLASGGIIGMLGMLNFGFGIMMIQRIASCYSSKDFEGISRYFTNALIVYLLVCSLYFAIGHLFSNFMPLILSISGDEAKLVVDSFNLMIIGMTVAIFNEYLKGLSQSFLVPLVPIISILIGRVLGITVTVWMLISGYGLTSIPAGFIMTEMVIFSINFINCLKLAVKHSLGFCINLETIKEYIFVSPFFIMNKLGNIISIQSQPLLLTLFIGPEATSVYMIIRRAAEIMLHLMRVIHASIMGTFAHFFSGSDKSKSAEIAEIILNVSIIFGVIGFSNYVAMNNIFISLWIDEDLIINKNLSIVIAVSFFATAMRGILGQMLYGIGDFKVPSVIALTEGLLAAFMSVVLINFFGAIGAAASLLLSSVIAVVVIGLRLNEKLSLQLKTNDFFKLILSTILLFILSFLVSLQNVKIDAWSLFFLALFVLSIIFSVVLLLFNFQAGMRTFKQLVN